MRSPEQVVKDAKIGMSTPMLEVIDIIREDRRALVDEVVVRLKQNKILARSFYIGIWNIIEEELDAVLGEEE